MNAKSKPEMDIAAMAQMHRDEMRALTNVINAKPPSLDWNKMVMVVIGAVCVFYVTGTLKVTESASISVPVITEKLSSIQASIVKLETQLQLEQTEHKSQMKGIEDRVRHLEMSFINNSMVK